MTNMFPIDIHKLWQQFAYNPEEPLLFSSGLFLFLFTGFVFAYSMLARTDRPKIRIATNGDTPLRSALTPGRDGLWYTATLSPRRYSG